jgi:hypothetical protein
VRRTIQTGLLRQATLIFWPGSSRLMSTTTGAPKALARSLGFSDARNGTAAKPAPTAPTTVVVSVRNLRRLRSGLTSALSGLIKKAPMSKAVDHSPGVHATPAMPWSRPVPAAAFAEL